MKAWESFLTDQESELGGDTVRKWLRSLKVVKFDACNLYLEAKDAFQAMWFEEHIRQKVQTRFVNNNNKKIKVHLAIANKPTPTSKAKAKKNTPTIIETPRFQLAFDELDPLCTFSHYFPLESNHLATKLIQQICGLDPECTTPQLGNFNPLYLHGRHGTGKTHLLMATAHTLRLRGINAVYSRAETFTEHVIAAIRSAEMSSFRQAYRNSDVLLIDDVHVFSKKGATQEEFFHTFNTLHLSGKQIVLAANCPPADLQMIEPRLVSRFEWGIVLGLEPAKGAELVELLEQKAAAYQFPLSPKVRDFLLETFTSHPKALIKALETLIMRAHLQEHRTRTPHASLTPAAAKHYLQDLIHEEQASALTPGRILAGVADFFGIMPEDIQGRSQTRDCVLPRQIAMHLCRTKLQLPFARIGELFDKDHSTVMSSVKLIQKGLDEDHPEIAGTHAMILKKIQV